MSRCPNCGVVVSSNSFRCVICYTAISPTFDQMGKSREKGKVPDSTLVRDESVSNNRGHDVSKPDSSSIKLGMEKKNTCPKCGAVRVTTTRCHVCNHMVDSTAVSQTKDQRNLGAKYNPNHMEDTYGTSEFGRSISELFEKAGIDNLASELGHIGGNLKQLYFVIFAFLQRTLDSKNMMPLLEEATQFYSCKHLGLTVNEAKNYWQTERLRAMDDETSVHFAAVGVTLAMIGDVDETVEGSMRRRLEIT